MKTTLITGLIGIGLLFAFVGFMITWVPATPLIIISVSVGLMVLYDFVQTVRFGEKY